MKNVILGMIGILVTLYTLQIGLNILYFQTQKNQLEKQVSRIVKHTLEAEYGTGDEAVVKQMLIQEMKEAISDYEGNLEIEVQGMDLQKGLLSVRVTKRVEMLNGKEKTVVVEKTAIMERVYVSSAADWRCQLDVETGDCTGWCI